MATELTDPGLPETGTEELMAQRAETATQFRRGQFPSETIDEIVAVLTRRRAELQSQYDSAKNVEDLARIQNCRAELQRLIDSFHGEAWRVPHRPATGVLTDY